MRLFVALELGPGFRQALLSSEEPLRASRPELRWEPAEKLHLTLSFLGEIDEAGARLASEAARRTAEGARAFPIVADGLLCLPKRRPATILAAAVTAGAAEAARLSGSFEDELEVLGKAEEYPFRPRERRFFTAHITLARSGRSGFLLTEEEMSRSPAAAGTAEALTLYESVLGSGGARYTARASYSLGH